MCFIQSYLDELGQANMVNSCSPSGLGAYNSIARERNMHVKETLVSLCTQKTPTPTLPW